MRKGNRTYEAVVTTYSFSKADMPRAETARRKTAVMAASTKAARRLGRNDKANTCEVLINLVKIDKRKVLKPTVTFDCGKRLTQNGTRPVRDVSGSARHTEMAVGG